MTNHIELEHDARRLLAEMIGDLGLRRQAFATGALMRALARRTGADEMTWYLTGLLADLDTEHSQLTPERHGGMAAGIIELRGFDNDIVSAVRRHAETSRGFFADPIEQALYAAADTARLFMAYIPPPGMSFSDVTVEMMLEKLNDADFAQQAERGHILSAEDMGLTMTGWFSLALEAVRAAKDDTLE